ncbi:MAG: hypothetical protein Q8P81_02585 [Nanoarchaeota archaeon]|nr:hypothetical protein [Nanoarchaeota archaeon]
MSNKNPQLSFRSSVESKIPRVGDSVSVFVRLPRGRSESIQAYYTGFNEVETLGYKTLTRPEGHVFVREGSRGLEIYCTRSKGLTPAWESEDDGAWPMGIPAERVHASLTDMEREFLQSRINVYASRRRAR